MRGQGPRWVVTALALAGCAACASAGGAAALLGGLGAALVVLGRRCARPPGPRALGLWRAGNALALLGAGVAAFAGDSAVLAGVGLVLWLLVHRVWTGRRAADERVLLLLALLLLLLACILSFSFALVPVFLAFALLSPAGLALSWLAREAEEAADLGVPVTRARAPSPLPLGVPTALLAVLFFGLTPRTDRPGALIGVERLQEAAGYGDEVAVGEGASLADNPAVVLRVRFPEDAPAGPWYLRGGALDTFDGRRWTRAAQGEVRLRSGPPPAGALRQEILQEALPEPVIFGVPRVVAFAGLDEPVAADVGDGIRLVGPPRSLSYTVWSLPERADPARRAAAEPDPRRDARGRVAWELAQGGLWTALPAELDGRVAALAREVVQRAGAGEGAWARAQALERFLRREFTYTARPDPALGGQSLAEFLFVSRRGHCEYFATALAVMLRAEGLPARVATGFLGGEWNALGDYLVFRQQDAHAWVELHLGEEGWVRLDGTPLAEELPEPLSPAAQAVDWLRSGWSRAILEYDLNDQLAVALALSGDGAGGPELRLPAGGGLALLALVGLGLGGRAALAALAGERRRRAPSPDPLTRLHARARRVVARRGWEIPASLPPLSAAEWLVARAGPPARPLLELARLLYAARYGGETAGPLLPRAKAALDLLAELPPPGQGPLAGGPGSG